MPDGTERDATQRQTTQRNATHARTTTSQNDRDIVVNPVLLAEK